MKKQFVRCEISGAVVYLPVSDIKSVRVIAEEKYEVVFNSSRGDDIITCLTGWRLETYSLEDIFCNHSKKRITI